jgi:hypothetical protein
MEEDSYAPIDEANDPIDIYRDEMDELARRPETSEASFASENRPIPSLIPEQDELADNIWRCNGQTIDLSENGIRFLLPPDVQPMRHLQLTILGDDGTRLTVLAEVLHVWESDEGSVVRARFRYMNDVQTHALIRLMFSDPNAWTRDRYTPDRPLTAFLSVATSLFRSVWYVFGSPPSENTPMPKDAREVHRPVLQCFHCNGVLLRPLPVCPHCGEPLSSVDDEHHGPYEGTIDRAGPRTQPRWPSYALPALLLVGAIVLGLGWDDLFETPSTADSPEEALALAHQIAAEDGVELADEFSGAIKQGDKVPADWGSRIAHRRFEYPRASDPREQVHEGVIAEQLGQLYYELHMLESRYRRGDPPPNLASDATRIRNAFDAVPTVKKDLL